jgi:hypothetical protein
VAAKHPVLTLVCAVVTVGTREGSDGLATCEQSERRRSEAGMAASLRLKRVLWPK